MQNNNKVQIKDCAKAYDRRGILVISLDFELLWGILDIPNPMKYSARIAGARLAIPKILALFDKYDIHATWGVVGLVMQKSIQSCMDDMPVVLPEYNRAELSAYSHFGWLTKCDKEILFARDLVDKIRKTSFQEIGTHTYSHYYCLESGQTKTAFESDIKKAQQMTIQYDAPLRSIIFPRNQYNTDYADVIKNYGIMNYRGNEHVWCYQSCETRKKKSLYRRVARFADNYINIFGNHCYSISEIKDENGLNNIRSSRFLRPYSKRFAIFEPLRIKRICSQVTEAAQRNQVFHLWWHPCNFGSHTEYNLNILEKILQHYHNLQEQYGMISLNMGELGEIIDQYESVNDPIASIVVENA